MTAIWLLPEGFDEALPDDAWRIETLRRRLIDTFQRWGYELVVPPLVEFVDSLLTGTGTELELQTFRFTDQQSGRMLGLRADMTPQVARIDAHRLPREGVNRLCYIGTVLHTHSDGLGGSRSPMQFGAELFGSDDVRSDLEILSLMLTSLNAAELNGVHLDLGHVGIFRALIHDAALDTDTELELFELLQAKAIPDLELWFEQRRIAPPLAKRLHRLALMHGDHSVLTRARAAFSDADPTIGAALDKLEMLAEQLDRRHPDVPIHFDLAELRGYHYHTGTVFAAYVPSSGCEIARGGRYDGIGKAFGRARPATGFSADLKLLLHLSALRADRNAAILAPASDDARLDSLIDRLRQGGERVICVFDERDSSAYRLECDRQLVLRDDQWVIESLNCQ